MNYNNLEEFFVSIVIRKLDGDKNAEALLLLFDESLSIHEKQLLNSSFKKASDIYSKRLEFQNKNSNNSENLVKIDKFNLDFNKDLFNLAKSLELNAAIISGDSMIYSELYHGDIVLYSTKENVESGDIAVIEINNQYYIKRIQKNESELVLKSENNKYFDVKLNKFFNFCIVGKVLFKIKKIN